MKYVNKYHKKIEVSVRALIKDQRGRILVCRSLAGGYYFSPAVRLNSMKL